MRCDKCNVEVKCGNICPLCHKKLDDNAPNICSDYPPKQGKKRLPLRVSPKNIYLILALVTAAVSIPVCYLTDTTYLWCWFAVAVLAYGYLLIGNTIFSNTEVGTKIFLQGCCIIALCYISDAVFKTAVATAYCLPIVITIMIATSATTLAVFYKHNRSLFVSCNLISLLGFIPIILFATKVTSVLIPAIVSAAVGGITLLVSITTGLKWLREQFSKVFHL